MTSDDEFVVSIQIEQPVRELIVALESNQSDNDFTHNYYYHLKGQINEQQKHGGA